MKNVYYNEFMAELENNYFENETVKSFISDAKELEKYGERRIALENLLENILECDIILTSELIEKADLALSDAPSEYDKELIEDLKGLN